MAVIGTYCRALRAEKARARTATVMLSESVSMTESSGAAIRRILPLYMSTFAPVIVTHSPVWSCAHWSPLAVNNMHAELSPTRHSDTFFLPSTTCLLSSTCTVEQCCHTYSEVLCAVSRVNETVQDSSSTENDCIMAHSSRVHLPGERHPEIFNLLQGSVHLYHVICQYILMRNLSTGYTYYSWFCNTKLRWNFSE